MRNPLVWRLILALGSGILIVGLCLDNVSKGAATFYARYPQTKTRRNFERTMTLVAEYESKNGRLPASAADWENAWGENHPLRDGWGRPIIHHMRGAKIQLVSYGQDGQPGGKGLNCDLTSDNPNPPQAKLSRLENLRHPLSKGMNIAALVCGLFVSILTFASIKNEAFERRNWLATGMGLLVILAATGFVSLFITLMHVPSGH